MSQHFEVRVEDADGTRYGWSHHPHSTVAAARKEWTLDAVRACGAPNACRIIVVEILERDVLIAEQEIVGDAA